MIRTPTTLTLLALVSSFASSAFAQSADDSARAEKLFTEAMTLVDQGNYTEACPKLEESERLDPALGTQYNLALCDAKLGKLASAWRNLTAVEKLAHATGKKGRADSAREKLDGLKPHVPHLVLTSADADALVKVDGEIVSREAFGFYAVEAGPHRIEASAPAKETWSTDVTVPESSVEGPGAEVSVPVPALVAVKGAVITVNKETVVTVQKETTNGKRIAGFVFGGVGLVGIAAAITTGVIILTDKSTADRLCTPACVDQTGRDAVSAGKTLLPINAVAWGVGIAGVGVGAVLLVLSAHKKPATTGIAPLLGPGTGGLEMHATF